MGRVLVQLPGSNTTKLLSETLPKNVIVVDEQLHQLRVHDGTTPGGHVIGDTAGSGVPIGTIIPFAGNSIPQGYLLCDGSAISRTNYAPLFAVIGTIYGAGDGNTTFNLPNTNWRALTGITDPQFVGVTDKGSLPAIRGSLIKKQNINGHFLNALETEISQSGSLYVSSTKQTTFAGVSGTGNTVFGLEFDASRSSGTYWRTDNEVHANSIHVYFIIKY